MAEILATRRWNPTPFKVIKGHRYRFSAHGLWRDWKTETDVSGYQSASLQRFESWRRLPEAHWFSLVGAVDKDRATLFDIGRLIAADEPWLAQKSGTLYGFANDVWFMYWNNHGRIELQMTEVS
jgi:hypothetical protein